MKVLFVFALLLACTMSFGSRSTTVSVVEQGHSYIAVDGKCIKGNVTVKVYNKLWENKYVYVYVISKCPKVSMDSGTFVIPPNGEATITGHAKNVSVVPVELKAYWDGGSAVLNLNIGCNDFDGCCK